MCSKRNQFIIITAIVAMSLSGQLRAGQADLTWSTLIGGSGPERAYGIAVGTAGHVFVIGNTRSQNFSTTTGAFDTTYNGGEDVFLVKVNSQGNLLIFATLLGGSEDDYGLDLALDDSENAYLTGHTRSPDFPVTAGAFDTTHNGGQDGFVAKFDSTGRMLYYATFLGGSADETAQGLAVDDSGHAHVVGYTGSFDFPTTHGAFASSFAGSEDVYVAKLNKAGRALDYATFLGGSQKDVGQDIAVGGFDNAYITGLTWSADFPFTAGAFDTTHNGHEDAFVVKFDPAGKTLSYATFLGGSSFDKGFGIAVDPTGHAHVTGYTRSTDFPITPGAFDSSHGGGWDVFIARLSPQGHSLFSSTYLGGSSYEKGFALAVDDSGRTYVTGYTWSADFPVTVGSFDDRHNGAEDVYVALLDRKGTALLYATYLGGSAYDESQGICVDDSGDIYVAGNTWSADFPVTAGALKKPRRGGHSDAFVARLSLDGNGSKPLEKALERR